MDYVPVILTVSLVVLTIVLTVVGIQLMLVLSHVKRTFEKLNNTLDTAEARLNSIVSPLQNLGGMASGLKTGIKVFETFVGWISRETKIRIQEGSNMDSSRQSHDAGSFATGFTLGIFAGAAGLYLFGTEDGKKLTKKLTVEWENARGAVLSESGLESSKSLREIAQMAKEKILMVLDGMGKSDSQVGAATKSVANTAKKAKAKSKPKFKGI